MKLSCDPNFFCTVYIYTHHSLLTLIVARSSDLLYSFPAKTRLVRGHNIHEDIEQF